MNEEILSTERLRALLKAFKERHAEEYHLRALGYFGSYARNEATPDSDIDVVFQTDHPDLFITAMLRQDLEAFLDRLAPRNAPHYTHTPEGSDDMPSHIKASLTPVSLMIPVTGGRLAMGTWQGIYLWEHRDDPGTRTLMVTVFE